MAKLTPIEQLPANPGLDAVVSRTRRLIFVINELAEVPTVDHDRLQLAIFAGSLTHEERDAYLAAAEIVDEFLTRAYTDGNVRVSMGALEGMLHVMGDVGNDD